MTKFMGKILTNDGTISCVIDCVPYTVNRSHVNYNQLLKAYNANDAKTFVEKVDVVTYLNNSLKSTGVVVKNDTVYYNDKPIHNNITTRILTLLRQGLDITPVKNFLANALQNTSSRAITEGFDFLDHLGIPLTEDGCFLAVKSVRSDFWSKTGGSTKLLKGKVDNNGRVYNGVGEVIECERNQVDDRRENQCSFGLHVGCWAYAGYGGWFNHVDDKVVICKVNPKDIVSVPQDHDATKMRVCGYTVLAEAKKELKKPVYTGNEVTHKDYDADEYDVDWCDDDSCDWSIDPYELVEGDYVEFDYTSLDGVTKHRTCQVDEHNHAEGFILGKLVFPEVDSGKIRHFDFSRMQNVQWAD